uniref:Uncharacterized protein n=1 Tax=Arundo donax TaxID=35708 RepID=A0A0A9GIZ4_ARUDO
MKFGSSLASTFTGITVNIKSFLNTICWISVCVAILPDAWRPWLDGTQS